jgi:geranyl-CoA carboxylase beta subunit
VRFAREVIARLNWGAAPVPRGKPPRYHAQELLGIMPPEHRTPVDMREAIARFADDSDFLDFKPDYGPATVCGHAAVQGFAVGIVTNNGPLDPDGATKATHFIQACCQAGLPLLYLQNTTGYIVGRASEEAGMIKHGSKMIQAVSNANVPQITLMCGASFGPAITACAGAPTIRASCSRGRSADRRDGRRAGRAHDGERDGAGRARKGQEPDTAQIDALKRRSSIISRARAVR